MKRGGALLACLATALVLALGGCAGPALSPPPQTIVYRPWTTAVLLTSSDPTVAPSALEARRTEVLAYLNERGFLTTRDTVVSDLARADRLLRVVVGSDGGFDVTAFTQSAGLGGGPARVETPGPTLIETAPVLPRSFRSYPSYTSPQYGDPFNDPLWPTPEFFIYRRYGEPDPSYRRYPRNQPPPVIVVPADPPPVPHPPGPMRPRDPAPESPTTREPPPPPTPRHYRRPEDRAAEEGRDPYPRPPK